MAKRSGYKYVTYLDDNPLSPTYMETYVEKVEDTEKCPIEEDDLVLISNECELSNSGYTGYRISVYFNRTTNEYSEVKALDTECEPSSTEEQWIASGDPYCETTEKGVNTGYMVQVEVQMNPNLSNYGEKRYEKYKSPECEANNCAIWDEVSHACHISVIDCVATFDGTADITEIDINPLSDTYNTTRTVNRVHNDCQNCTNTLFEWRTVGTMCGDDEILCGNGIQQASTNSYLVSQRYKIIGSGTPTPMDEYQVVLYAEDDENCGYIKPMYKMEKVGGYLCDYETYTKYERYARMVSYDSGVTWSVAQPLYTERGEVIAEESYDCGRPMYRWIDNGETTCVDNGDDAKLLIQDGNGNVIYKLPCNESSSLSCDELEGMVSNMQNARFVTFGNCVSTINSPLISECNYHTQVGDSGAGESARLKFGDYVEVIGSHDVFQHSYLFDEAFWKAYDDTFGEHLRIIRGEALGGRLEAEDNIIHLKSGIELIESGGLSMRYGGNSLIMDAATPPSIGNNAFSNIDGIFVPSGTVEAYRETWEGKYEDILFSLAEEDTFYRATYDNGEQGWNFSSEGTNGVLTKAMTHASYKGRSSTSITDAYLSNSITTIGNAAFDGCSSLSGLSIPLSVQYIYPNAFNGCSGTNENNLSYLDTYLIRVTDKSVGSYTIKDGTRYIANGIWGSEEQNDVTMLSIPSSVEYIGSLPPKKWLQWTAWGYRWVDTTWWDNFLNDSSNWENGVAYLNKYVVAVESGITELRFRDDTLGIAYEALGDNTYTSIELPSTLKYLGHMSLSSLHYSGSLVLPNSLVEIGTYAFSSADITDISIPSSVKYVGNDAFWATSSLTGITVDYEYIEDSFNTNFDSLTTITLGENVKQLAPHAFGGRKNNISVYSYASTPPILGNNSIQSRGSITVYVPSNLVDIYKSSPYWRGFNINAINE